MSIDLRKRFQMILQYLEQSWKRIVFATLIPSVVTVIVFVFGSSYLFYRYYEKQQKEHYATILRDISLFQSKIISKESYRDDIINLCTSLKKQRGVLNAWVSDRFGRLMYHTDSRINDEFNSRRLPVEYYESIQHSWEFKEGAPLMHEVPLEGRLSMRVTIPLYAYGREDYDFILGLDVKRFVFIPVELSSLRLLAACYITGSILLLFLPVFLWVRSRFRDILYQSKVIIGQVDFKEPKVFGVEKVGIEGMAVSREAQAIKAEPQMAEAPKAQSTRVKPEVVISAEEEIQAKLQRLRQMEEEREKIRARENLKVEEEVEYEEAREEIPAKKEIVEGKMREEVLVGGKPGEEEVAISSEAEVQGKKPERKVSFPGKGFEERLERFIKLKGTLFKKQTLELPFIQCQSYIYNSGGVEGSYIFYHKTNQRHFYINFSLRGVKSEQLFELIPEMRAYGKRTLGRAGSLKDWFVVYNGYCFERSLTSHISAVLVNEEQSSVEYASCGDGFAVYLKRDEEETKDLVFDLPPAGLLQNNDFVQSFYMADVRFSPNDIFVVLPSEARSLRLGVERVYEIMKSSIKKNRDLSAKDISLDVASKIEGFVKGKANIPQTGFIILKYL
ncbi:MAG: hypothetical protein ACUVWJ_07305 [Spirochaetota bacterium]